MRITAKRIGKSSKKKTEILRMPSDGIDGTDIMFKLSKKMGQDYFSSNDVKEEIAGPGGMLQEILKKECKKDFWCSDTAGILIDLTSIGCQFKVEDMRNKKGRLFGIGYPSPEMLKHAGIEKAHTVQAIDNKQFKVAVYIGRAGKSQQGNHYFVFTDDFTFCSMKHGKVKQVIEVGNLVDLFESQKQKKTSIHTLTKRKRYKLDAVLMSTNSGEEDQNEEKEDDGDDEAEKEKDDDGEEDQNKEKDNDGDEGDDDAEKEKDDGGEERKEEKDDDYDDEDGGDNDAEKEKEKKISSKSKRELGDSSSEGASEEEDVDITTKKKKKEKTPRKQLADLVRDEYDSDLSIA